MTSFPVTARKSLRLLGPAAVAATLGLGALPAFAQTTPTAADCSAIRFELANPSPGSEVNSGAYVLQGTALDSRAQTGSGISSVDFFLDNRDQGGMSLGSVAPDMVPGPFGTGSFQTTVTLPNLTGGHDLVAYARSSVTGQESVIEVPIAVNEDPAKAGLTSTAGNTPTATEMCSSTPPFTTTSPAATTPAPAALPAPVALSPSASTISFEVGNPSPGDTIHVGNLNVEGIAMDRAAQSGSGIDRVQISLDPRDQGGVALGDATLGANNQWHATMTVPSNVNGMHTLTFYAYSSVTGAESVVSVPVTVAP